VATADQERAVSEGEGGDVTGVVGHVQEFVHRVSGWWPGPFTINPTVAQVCELMRDRSVYWHCRRGMFGPEWVAHGIRYWRAYGRHPVTGKLEASLYVADQRIELKPPDIEALRVVAEDLDDKRFPETDSPPPYVYTLACKVLPNGKSKPSRLSPYGVWWDEYHDNDCCFRLSTDPDMNRPPGPEPEGYDQHTRCYAASDVDEAMLGTRERAIPHAKSEGLVWVVRVPESPSADKPPASPFADSEDDDGR